jgi:riboflavin synthase
MFTGIIEDIGRVTGIEVSGASAKLVVATRLATGASHAPSGLGPHGGIRLGDSIAVSGACLTVTRHEVGALSFDVSRESLLRTALGALTAGAKVHLERAMVLGGRLDGHLVQGHIDGLARLVAKDRVGPGWELAYELPETLLPFVVEKGSIALDGVSLTIAKLVGARITVAVVPLTGQATLLADTPLGAADNVETDILGKYVHRLLGFAAPPGAHHDGARGVTLGLLADNGFLTR